MDKIEGPTIDLLNKPAPELSSTSDVPTESTTVVEGPPLSEQAGGETPDAPTPMKVADKKADAEGAEPPADKKADAEPPKDGEKKKDGLKERMGEMTAQRRAAEDKAATEEAARKASEERADKLEAQLKDTLARIDKVIPKVDEDPRPQRAAFDDPAKYDDALAQWGTRQGEKIGKAQAETEFKAQSDAERRKAAEDAQTAQNQKIAKEYAERVEKIRESEPDYDTLVQNPDLPISPAVSAAIMTTEDGPKIALWLARNPAEAKRIYELAPMAQIYEVGKISVALNAPPKTTTAPNPIEPLKGGQNAANKKSPNEESMAEYGARREAELRAERAAQLPRKKA